MQLGRQDAADRTYLPTAELKSYTPKRAGKDLGVLFAKEGGVQVILFADHKLTVELSDYLTF